MIVFPLPSDLSLHNDKKSTPTRIAWMRCAYRGVHRSDCSCRNTRWDGVLCLEHHAALGSQSDDDWAAASPQQLLTGAVRFLHAGYRGASEQLSLQTEEEILQNCSSAGSSSSHVATDAEWTRFPLNIKSSLCSGSARKLNKGLGMKLKIR